MTLGDESSIAGAEESRTLDVDDFRRWWRQSLAQEATENRLRGRKLNHIAIASAAIALVSLALALKGGAPTVLNRPSVAPLANDTAKAQNPGNATAGTPADTTTLPPAGVSGAMPVALEVAAQAVKGGASKTAAQTADVVAAPTVSARPEGTPIATQISSVVANARKPPPSEQTSGTVRTTQPSIDMPVKRLSKIAARVVVGKTEADIPSAAADAPTPPLPIGTAVEPEREASRAKASQPVTESVAASAAPAEAAKQSANPFLQALGDLFGARVLPGRQSIDTAAVGSTGWAVQLGAPRSEAEAKRDLKRLNARYGSALRGSTVGLHKVLVKGEIVYQLHVVGLSRNEAAALCSRVKGDGGGCTIVR